MAFCANCGSQVQDGVKFCPSCGKAVGAAPTVQAQPEQAEQQPQQFQPEQQFGQQQFGQQQFEQQQQFGQQSQQAPQSDAEANKGMAILSYIIFFIPLLAGTHKKSPFVKYHVNQGIIFTITWVAFQIISAILRSVIRVEREVWGIPYYATPGWLSTILWLVTLAIWALGIIGIINAVKGETKPIPIIGDKITIIN